MLIVVVLAFGNVSVFLQERRYEIDGRGEVELVEEREGLDDERYRRGMIMVRSVLLASSIGADCRAMYYGSKWDCSECHSGSIC